MRCDLNLSTTPQCCLLAIDDDRGRQLINWGSCVVIINCAKPSSTWFSVEKIRSILSSFMERITSCTNKKGI